MSISSNINISVSNISSGCLFELDYYEFTYETDIVRNSLIGNLGSFGHLKVSDGEVIFDNVTTTLLPGHARRVGSSISVTDGRAVTFSFITIVGILPHFSHPSLLFFLAIFCFNAEVREYD